jgi:hypothetical protein
MTGILGSLKPLGKGVIKNILPAFLGMNAEEAKQMSA